MEKIPEKFWAKWYDAYEAGNEDRMQKMVSKMLVTRIVAKQVGQSDLMASPIVNQLFVDFAEYMKTRLSRRKMR